MVVASRSTTFAALGSLLATAGHAVVLRRQPGGAPTPLGVCGCAPAPACTCQGTLGYAHCVAIECHKGCMDPACSAAAFFEQCGKAHDRCSTELSLDCGMDEATCIGNFHQAADGVAGLTLETESMTDNAHCGPHGKCLGNVVVKAEVRNAPNGTLMECVMPSTPAAHPTPGSRESCLSGPACDGVAHASVVSSTNYCCEGGSVAPHVVYGDPSTCSCASTYQELWLSCSAPVAGTEASCSMPMVETLDVGVKLKGSCWLAAYAGGTRLTQHAHFVIENTH